jgi:hypothetical protein
VNGWWIVTGVREEIVVEFTGKRHVRLGFPTSNNAAPNDR